MEGYVVIVAVVLVGIAYIFQIWVRYQRRLMIHRERLAAIEKGTELPPLEQEIQRGGWNVQRLLLLAGLVWISLGVATFPLMVRLGGHAVRSPWDPFPLLDIPRGLEWIGLGLIGIGISHLVTFAVGRQREREESRRS
jgi:hypothetical protein